jgi:hypothetical protein
LIIAHRNPAYHAKRAAIWIVLAAAPWVVIAFSPDMSDLGRGWAGAALVSPIAVGLSAKELWTTLAGRTRVVWVDGDGIVSDRFHRSRSELASVRTEHDRPRYGIGSEQFVVFEFEDGTTVRMLAKRLFETPDDIVQAALALPR